MKLVIQIPCHNEEATLPATLEDLPREVEGFDEVEILVIDDGSTDRTAEIARQHGVGHLVRLSARQGLARAFAAGIDEALGLGADVIVNTDGDNQYDGGAVEPLVRPILGGRADMVVGERVGAGVEEFSPVKKGLQKLGSWVVSKVSGLDVGDAASGFRAFSREVAQVLEVRDRFTYTVETLIQAGAQGIKVSTVPVRTNPKTRESRLCSSMWRYVARSAGTVLRAHARHRPGRTAAGLVILGLAAGALGGPPPSPETMVGPMSRLTCLLRSRACAPRASVLRADRKRMPWRAETSRVEALTPPGS